MYVDKRGLVQAETTMLLLTMITTLPLLKSTIFL